MTNPKPNLETQTKRQNSPVTSLQSSLLSSAASVQPNLKFLRDFGVFVSRSEKFGGQKIASYAIRNWWHTRATIEKKTCVFSLFLSTPHSRLSSPSFGLFIERVVRRTDEATSTKSVSPSRSFPFLFYNGFSILLWQLDARKIEIDEESRVWRNSLRGDLHCTAETESRDSRVPSRLPNLRRGASLARTLRSYVPYVCPTLHTRFIVKSYWIILARKCCPTFLLC